MNLADKANIDLSNSHVLAEQNNILHNGICVPSSTPPIESLLSSTSCYVDDTFGNWSDNLSHHTSISNINDQNYYDNDESHTNLSCKRQKMSVTPLQPVHR